MLDRNRDIVWEAMGLADAKRPPDPDVEYIGDDEWGAALADCMTDRGFVGYVESGGGIQMGDYTGDEYEAIAWYLCQATYQYDPRVLGGINASQLDYMYEYNRDTLVPCLEGHGIDVEQAPPRDEATTIDSEFAGWNPYYYMADGFDPTTNKADRNIYESCPPFPRGEPFDSFEIWPGT